MKILNSKIHGVIDYAVVAALWLSPTIFNLPPTTSFFTYVLGAIHLALTVSTDFEVGVVKLVPLKIHGIIELIVSVVLVIVSFYLGSAEGAVARNFYLVVAVAVFATWVVTDYTYASKRSRAMM